MDRRDPSSSAFGNAFVSHIGKHDRFPWILEADDAVIVRKDMEPVGTLPTAWPLLFVSNI